MSILIDGASRVVVHGLTGREGSFHGAAMLEYGTQVVAGHDAGQGRPDGARRPRAGVRHRRRRGPRDRRRHVLHLRPGGRRARCGHGGGRRRDQDDLLHHRGHPGARHDPRGGDGPGGRRPADRPELSRRDVAGPGQGRDHPGLDPSRGLGRSRLPFGDAHLRGRPGDDRRRDRPVDVRRDRRRSGHRHDVPRRPPAVRRRRRDDRDRPDRRDRRSGRGDGRRLVRRAPGGRPEGRLHRRPDRPRGQADGPRRRDHLRRGRDRRIQGRGTRGRGLPRRRLARRSCRSSCATPATATEPATATPSRSTSATERGTR